MIDEKWIKEKIRNSEYYVSRHGDQERQNDNLSILEVEESLLNGRILEQYPDTGRSESCLVVGFTEDGKPAHVVCGKRKDTLTIVTVYISAPPKFKNPYEKG